MQQQRSRKIDFREIFRVVRFSTFATISANNGSGSALIHRSSATNEWPLSAAKGSNGLYDACLLAQPFLLILLYIDQTICSAALDALSNRTLAPFVCARTDVTKSGRRSCLGHEFAGQSNKECQGEKRKYETRHRLLQQNEE
jgi:hypothetical protein